MSPCITIFCYFCGWRLRRRGTVVYLPSSCQSTWKYLKICKIRKPDHGIVVRSWCSFLLVNNFLLCFTFLLFLSSAIIATQLPSNTTVQYTLILNILQWIHVSWLSIILDYYANTTGETIVIMSPPTFNCYLFRTRLLDFFFFLCTLLRVFLMSQQKKHSE